MKEFSYTINGTKYDVAVGERKGNNVEVTVNGEAYTVETEPKNVAKVQAPAAKTAAKPAAKPAVPAAPAAAGAGDPVKAPLPGTIKDVCVAVGDQVTEGQTLVVLEAMKMANNIESEKSGKVTAVFVNVGDAVMEDTPLVVVE